MKTKYITFFLVCLTSANSLFAQNDNSQSNFSKGKAFVSVKFSGAHLSNRGTIVSTGVRYSQFLFDKTSVGFEANQIHTSFDYSESNLGLFARHNFTKGKISPFVELNYKNGIYKEFSRIDNSFKTDGTNRVILVGGVVFNLSKKLNIELLLENELTNSNSLDESFIGIRLQYKLH